MQGVSSQQVPYTISDLSANIDVMLFKEATTCINQNYSSILFVSLGNQK